MKVEILDMRLLEGDKPLRGFADVQIGDIVIREFRVIKENGKRAWVAAPQISWKGSDGHIQYKTIVTLRDEVKGRVDQVVLNRFTEEMERKNGLR